MNPGPSILRSELEPLVRQRDLVLVTGKGGVGKSTLVAALARLAVRHRGGALAVEVSAHPRLARMLPPAADVALANIDVDDALPRVLGRLLHLPALISGMLSNRLLRMFVRTSPAVAELILLDELYELVAQHTARGWPVIVDLPATGHAVTLLDTPASVRRMLRVGPVANRAGQIERLLLDHQRCELVVVSLPEELPVNETIELLARAAEVGVASRTVLVNQVPVTTVQEDDRGLIELLQADGDAHLHAAAGMAASALDDAGQARDQIERLRRSVSGRVIEVPLLADADPIARADAIARALAP